MSTLTLHLRDTTVLGIALMVGFAVTGPMIDGFAKLAATEIPAGETAFFRFAVQVAILIPVALALGKLARPSWGEAGLHMLRGALIVVSTILFFAALKWMPVADAIAVFFVEPLILTILSGLLLGERVGWRRYAACGVGFFGAMLVIQPSFAEVGWVAALPVGTAACFAVYLVLTRVAAQRHDPLDLQTWAAAAGTVQLGAILLAFEGSGSATLDPVMPPVGTWWMLAGVGVAATISHLFITYAFRYAEAAVLAPLQYLEIVTATLIGLAVFGDFPDPLTWAGVAIVIASGLFVAWRERRAVRRGMPTPPR